MYWKNNDTYLIKVLLLGDNDVGKTSIIKQFIEHEYLELSPCVIGIDFRAKKIQIENNIIKMLIFDVVAQERFRNITRIYYKNTYAIIFVYSIGDRKSFDNIKVWLEDIEKYAQPNIIKILVGNKIDIESTDRQVEFEEAKSYSESNNFIKFYESSAKKNINIYEIFIDLSKYIIEKNIINNFVRLEIEKNSTHKRKFLSC